MFASVTAGWSGMWQLEEHKKTRLARFSLSLVLGSGCFYVKQNGVLCTLLLGLMLNGKAIRPAVCDPPEQVINRLFYSEWMSLLIFIIQLAYCNGEW